MIHSLLFSVMLSGLALIASAYNNANAVVFFTVGAGVSILVGTHNKRNA